MRLWKVLFDQEFFEASEKGGELLNEPLISGVSTASPAPVEEKAIVLDLNDSRVVSAY
jgi:hypothetical protein